MSWLSAWRALQQASPLRHHPPSLRPTLRADPSASLGKRMERPDSRLIYTQATKACTCDSPARVGRISSGPRAPLFTLPQGQKPDLVVACKVRFYQRASLLTCFHSLALIMASWSHQTKEGIWILVHFPKVKANGCAGTRMFPIPASSIQAPPVHSPGICLSFYPFVPM